MKRIHLLVLVGVAVALTGAVPGTSAEPIGTMATPIDHLVVAKDLHSFGVGVYGGATERGVDVDGVRGSRDLKGEELMAYVSYYPLNWLSAYAGGGYGRFELSGEEGGYGSEEAQWAFGARANLLDHDMADPWIFEDRIRVTVNANYSLHDAPIGQYHDAKWSEFKASLYASIVNDVVGNKHFLPQTIALYAGPVYSVIGGDDLDETENVGFAGGLQAQLSAHTALGIGVEELDGTSFLAGLDVRF